MKTLTSLAIWGPGGGGGRGSFNNQTGPSWFTSILSFILIYMSNIEAISWYDKNLLIFKIKKIKIYIYFFFFVVMFGPYIKSRGTRGTEMSSNAALITMETYVQQGETIWKPVFHRSQNVKKMYILGYLGGPEGVFNYQTEPILLSSYPLTYIHVHVK